MMTTQRDCQGRTILPRDLAAAIAARPRSGVRLAAYRCRFCTGWHLAAVGAHPGGQQATSERTPSPPVP